MGAIFKRLSIRLSEVWRLSSRAIFWNTFAFFQNKPRTLHLDAFIFQKFLSKKLREIKTQMNRWSKANELFTLQDPFWWMIRTKEPECVAKNSISKGADRGRSVTDHQRVEIKIIFTCLSPPKVDTFVVWRLLCWLVRSESGLRPLTAKPCPFRRFSIVAKFWKTWAKKITWNHHDEPWRWEPLWRPFSSNGDGLTIS